MECFTFSTILLKKHLFLVLHLFWFCIGPCPTLGLSKQAKGNLLLQQPMEVQQHNIPHDFASSLQAL